MDSKRKSIFSLPPNSQGKKTKIHHQRDWWSETSLEDVPVEKNETGSRFTFLKRPSSEVMDNPKSVQTHTGEAGPNVVKTATELDKAFCLPISSDTSTYAVDYLHGENPPETPNISKNKSNLPVLPPILDDMLQKAVFTHPGLSNNNEATYDRLEILGDAYIELIATKLVWSKFQEISSGRISQLRELLVKNETLSEYTTRYGLDRRASVPQGYQDQPKRWTKTKGDIFEAYVAAVILSNPIEGFRIAEEWLTQLWLPKLAGLGAQKSKLHAKEALAKKIMGKGVRVGYIDEHPPVSLRGGVQTFYIGVYLSGWGWNRQHLGSGQGLNKAMAGDEAAKQALLNKPLIDEIAATKRGLESEQKPA